MSFPVRVIRNFIIACGAALIAFPGIGVAQQIHGTVFEPDGVTPASGVVVLLLHEFRSDSIVARSVTSERGLYTLKAAGASVVRLRALRIGLEPLDVGRFQLDARTDSAVRITLANKRIALAAVVVKDASRCELRPDGARLVSQLFMDAKTALVATTAPTIGVERSTSSTNYVRTENMRGELLSPVQRTTSTRATTQPFVSLAVDSLTRRGYVVPSGDGTIYYAPDANVLLSDAFAAQHCLYLEQGTANHAGLVGIGFKPVNRPRGIIDISGTLWLDRVTNELQYLEYNYEPLPIETRRAKLGGRVEYTRMADGGWVISRWSIRTPVLELRQLSLDEMMRGSSASNQPVVTALKIVGGEVGSVRVGDNVLYANPAALLAGAAPGDVRVAVGTNTDITRDAVDSDAAADGCASSRGSHGGKVRGTVRDNGRAAISLAQVSASWKEDFTDAPGGFGWQNRAVSTTSRTDGRYALCSLPLENPVTVAASHETRRSHSATVRITETQPVVELDLTIAVDSAPVPVPTVTISSGSRIRVRAPSNPSDTNSILQQAGFYQRVFNMQRGTIAGEIFRVDSARENAGGTISQLLAASKIVKGNRVRGNDNAVVLNGSTGCAMPVMLNGQLVNPLDGSGHRSAVDDSAGGARILAIEVYANARTTPVSVASTDMACGVVLVWTAPR